jgi:hypothetical protein
MLCALIFWLFVGPWLQEKVRREQEEHEEAISSLKRENAQAKAKAKKNLRLMEEILKGAGSSSEETPSETQETPSENQEKPSDIEEASPELTPPKSTRAETKANEDKNENTAVLRDPISGSCNSLSSLLRLAWQKFGENTYKQDIQEMSFRESK